MKISEIRKHRKKRKLLPELLEGNPLLFLGIDLPFVVVAAISLKTAVALSLEIFFIHIVTMFVAWMIAPKLSVGKRVFITALVAMIMMLLSRELAVCLIPDVENRAGIYMSLIAVNGLTLFQANFLSKEAKLSQVMKTSCLNVLAFSGIMIGISMIREYFGNGTLWEIPLPSLVKLNGVMAPFFGFILVGFLLAVMRKITKTATGLYVLDRVRSETNNQPTNK